MTSLEPDDIVEVKVEVPVTLQNVTLESYHILCLVCNEKVEINLSDFEEKSDLFGEKYLSLFWIFCGHMKVNVDDAEEEFDFSVEPFIFCKSCCKQLIELNKVHRKLTNRNSNYKGHRIDKIIAGLSTKILNSYDHHNNNDDDYDDESSSMFLDYHQSENSFNFVVQNTRRKVQVIRRSIFNSYNVSVFVERLPILRIVEPITTTTTNFDNQQNVEHGTDVEMMEDVEDFVSTPDKSLTDSDEDDDYEDVILLSDDDLSDDGDEFDDLLSSSDEDDEEDDDDETLMSRKETNLQIKIRVSKPQRHRGKSKGKSIKVKIPRKPKKDKKSAAEPTPVKRRVKVKSTNNEEKKEKTVRRRRRNSETKTTKPKRASIPKTKKERPAVYKSVKQLETDVNGVTKFLYVDEFPFEKFGELFTCRTCHKYSCPSKKNIIQHMRNQHYYLDKFACTLCDKRFSRDSQRKDHEAEDHVAEATFLCDECGQAFKTSKTLNIHLALRHGSCETWKYRCTIDNCGQNFKCNKLLTAHQRRYHTGEMPFECSTCQKRFVLKEVMVRHMQCHLTFKPFLCGVCGKGFNRNSTVRIHEKFVHAPNKVPRRPNVKKATSSETTS